MAQQPWRLVYYPCQAVFPQLDVQNPCAVRENTLLCGLSSIRLLIFLALGKLEDSGSG